MDGLAFAYATASPNDPSMSRGHYRVIPMLMSASQELTADATRIELTRRNAAVLEAKAAEERAKLLALRTAHVVDGPGTPAQAITDPAAERVDPAAVSNQELREKFAEEQKKRLQADSLPRRPDADGAEAWTPRAVRRRG